MKKIITFDTNYIDSNFQRLPKIVETLKQHDYECVITQMALEEIEAQEIRKIINEYDNLKSRLDTKIAKKYFTILDASDLAKSFDLVHDEINSNIGKLFDVKISEFKDDEVYRIILERLKFKKPPFVLNGSDKGFKDSVIWINLIKFYKNKENIHLYFITNDKGFIKSGLGLENEFLKETYENNQFEIVTSQTETDLYRKLEIDIKNIKEDIKLNTEGIVEIGDSPTEHLSDELVSKLHEAIYHILYTFIAEDSQGYNYIEPYDAQNITISKEVSIEDIKKFCEYLNDNIKTKYMFFIDIDISEIFRNLGYNCRRHYDVPRNAVSEFLKYYLLIDKQYHDFIYPFFELIKSYVGKLVDGSLDLPF